MKIFKLFKKKEPVYKHNGDFFDYDFVYKFWKDSITTMLVSETNPIKIEWYLIHINIELLYWGTKFENTLAILTILETIGSKDNLKKELINNGDITEYIEFITNKTPP